MNGVRFAWLNLGGRQRRLWRLGHRWRRQPRWEIDEKDVGCMRIYLPTSLLIAVLERAREKKSTCAGKGIKVIPIAMTRKRSFGDKKKRKRKKELHFQPLSQAFIFLSFTPFLPTMSLWHVAEFSHFFTTFHFLSFQNC